MRLDELGLNLDQYSGLWAVEDVRFTQTLEHVRGLDLAAHVKLQLQAQAGDPQPQAKAAIRRENVDGVVIAIIDVEGTLTKRGSSLSAAASLVALRRAVGQADADPNIDAAATASALSSPALPNPFMN